ncbi:MAG: polysaccharide pyruvyl transferase CsaB [Firmicutes bacterium]|nr:polysaccharide pyruvyl transferase CsaB [Bacillota bacterium]
MKFVISGYYGFENSGDDALLLTIIRQIRNDYKNAQITVLSKSPKKTAADYGVVSVYRYNPLSVIFHILKCNLLISGGGTLIQDATSTKSLIYYLAIIKIARFFKKKVMLYANGIGPLTSFKNIEKTKNVLNDVDLITLRDKNSVYELEQIGVTKPRIELTADPVFLLQENGDADKILDIYKIPQDKKLMCISVREWRDNPSDFVKIIAEFCDYAKEKYDIYTVFLPMQTSVDYQIALKIKNAMKNSSTIVSGKYSFETILSLIGKMYACVGMRLHSIIYAAKMLVPAIGLVYDPKVKGFLEYINEDRFIDVTEIDREILCKTLDGLCENYDAIKSHMKYEIRDMRKKAELNGELMKNLLNGEEN